LNKRQVAVAKIKLELKKKIYQIKVNPVKKKTAFGFKNSCSKVILKNTIPFYWFRCLLAKVGL
jgi:hypothetical protein